MKFAEKVGLSFARAFVASLVLLVPGILNAPDLGAAKGLALAALIAAATAGVRAIQFYFEP
jgi:hypothetical protein